MKNKYPKSLAEDLRFRIAPIRTAMLTTRNGVSMNSRPMHTIEMDDNGDLWFFTSMHSIKVKDIKKDAVVNVTYADDDKQVFVSITGIARMIYDKTRIVKLWKPVFKTWFENGVSDPSLILINIKISHAEYWDASEYKMRNILNLFGSLLTGDPMEVVSEHNSYEL